MADRDVVILGVGLHPFGRFPEKSVEDMGRVAILEALDDAGISYGDVQAGFCGRVQGGSGTGVRVFGEVGMTGIPITNVELACASSTRATMLAADQIQAGVYDVALVVGVEQMQRGMLGGGGGERSYGQLMGHGIMPGSYALMARRHMERYGTKPEHFAQVSVKSHQNGALNPNAQYQSAVTLEDVMNSRMIAEPVTLLESCPTTDGAAAVVVATEKFARQHTSAPVHLRAWAGGSPVYADDDEGLAEGPTTVLARSVYERAGVGPDEVDVVQVHDAFAPGEIFAIEDLGLCAPGEGGPFVWEGNTEIGGTTPVNTDGGLLSRGHPMGATGCAMLAEQTRQLRGQAGPRQVEDAKVALIHNQGIGGVNVLMMER